MCQFSRPMKQKDYRGYVTLVATLKRSFLSRQQLSKVHLKSVILKSSLFPAPAISEHGSILRISPWAFMWAKLAKWSIFHQTDPEVFIGRCYQSPGTRLCDISAVISTTATPCSMAFQNTNMIACSGFYTQLHTLSACYSSSVTSVYSPL